MSLTLKLEDNYERVPAGMHNAVCVDVEDLGDVEVEWKGEKKIQHKINIYWQLEEKDSKGARFIQRKRYTFSMYDTARLRQDLEQWRGRKFTNEELKTGFDVLKLIGVPCTLQIAHEESEKGKTYANITSVLPYDKRLGEQLKAEDYTRPAPRAKPESNPAWSGQTADSNAEVIPF